MPADEVTHGTDVDQSRGRTGPRHAAPKKPLFTRFHMPAGTALAVAAMPTAVLMGMGFTPTLARAQDQPSSKNLTVDEYQDCVEALDDSADGTDPSATPSPSASGAQRATETDETTEATSPPSKDTTSSSDSRSDDKAEPLPSTSAARTPEKSADSGTSTATPAPSVSESGDNLLDTIGDAITDVFDGGSDTSASATPAPVPAASASEDTSDDDASDTAEDTTDKVAEMGEDAVEDTTGEMSEAAEDIAAEVAEAATAPPSPSASSTTDGEACPAATDEEGGVEQIVALPDDPWYLSASSLLLKGADYQGIVEVKTADGTVKEVLKYVVSDGTDIGDLHQTVRDEQAGTTYHVQAAEGSTSTIRGGETVMYTESISGSLFGLVPVTFSPQSPPPLNVPLIYFTEVKVVQAGQFGGDLHVPGLHQYTTDLN